MKINPYKPVDNAPLILFRIFFGLLFACDTFGAIFNGWVSDNFVTPVFTFSHIGMDWLQPLPGYGMFFYFGAMGLLSLLVMVGYRYRWSLGLLTLLWSGVYFMQKTSYNNHYYLLLLVAIIMLFLPAYAFASIDARRNPKIKSLAMPVWCSWIMIAQISIVYFFATIAKFYPDWLDGSYVKNLFSGIDRGSVIHSKLYTQHWFHLFIAYSGILFDGLIVPALLWKKTRNSAVVLSLLFHVFNSMVLKIGIFPYFALSFALFFYNPETIRSFFFKSLKPEPNPEDFLKMKPYKAILRWFFIPYLVIQLLLPVRHWFIKGDVLWTEEGHRLSWRMMLRERNGSVTFKVINKKTGEMSYYPHKHCLTRKQEVAMASRPDMIWQMARHIKKEYQAKGQEVMVYVDCFVSVNRRPFKRFVKPDVDIAAADWNYFGHSDWVLLYDNL